MIIYFAVGNSYQHNMELTRQGCANRLLSYFYIGMETPESMEEYGEKGFFPAKNKRGKTSKVRRKLRT